MKLSDIVAYLNLLDSLDVKSECNAAVSRLNHITHVVSEHAEQDQSASHLIGQTFDDLSGTIAKFSAQVENLKQSLKQEIEAREQEYLATSLTVYQEQMKHDDPDMILKRRMGIDDNDDMRLRTHLKNLTDWRIPGMIIRPGLETYIEDMVPMDPLYVVDHDPELMQPAISKFTPEYQRRLREYVINDWADGPILGKLPNNQFGAIFAYQYFNHKPIPIIHKFLDEFYEKLRPGGSVIMTYNNCDLAHGVIRSEHVWMLYTPRRLIEQHAVDLGFELTEAYDGKGDVSWLEFRKPGDIASIRGGQTLAKIVAKTD
jgi:SAM-dependent methyltransferase